LDLVFVICTAIHPSALIKLAYSFIRSRQCLKVPANSTKPAKLDKGSPIRVAPKPKQQKLLKNVFLDNWGFPDKSKEYDHVLHNIGSGPILRKLRHL
jgi:hypothetical protein